MRTKSSSAVLQMRYKITLNWVSNKIILQKVLQFIKSYFKLIIMKKTSGYVIQSSLIDAQ